MQSYTYFEAGFVIKVGTKVAKGFYILSRKVRYNN